MPQEMQNEEEQVVEYRIPRIDISQGISVNASSKERLESTQNEIADPLNQQYMHDEDDDQMEYQRNEYAAHMTDYEECGKLLSQTRSRVSLLLPDQTTKKNQHVFEDEEYKEYIRLYH